MDLIRRHCENGNEIGLAALPAGIGIRETRKAVCAYRLTENDVLNGVRFPDAIANGSYRVDIHESEGGGLVFRYLDGREVRICPGRPTEQTRWRQPRDRDPTFYQIPYRSLLPRGFRNLLVAGRIIGTDKGAFGAVRVVINCNQTGEAAGAAAALALDAGCPVNEIDTSRLRRTLASKNGSVII